MDWRRSQITRILRKVLLFIVITATTTSLAYFGVKWWLKYANTEAFKGEVNAAIITGVVTVITLVVTTWVSWYTAKRSQEAVLRDEYLKRRFDIYQELISDLLVLDKLYKEFFDSADPEIPPRIIQLVKQMSDKTMQYQHLISYEAMDLLIKMIATFRNYFNSVQELSPPQEYAIKQLKLAPTEKIVTSEELRWSFDPLIWDTYLVMLGELSVHFQRREVELPR